MLSPRQQHILGLLLASDEPLSLAAIGREAGVSPRTAGNDVTAIADFLAQRGFTVHRKPGVGVWLEPPTGAAGEGWDRVLGDAFAESAGLRPHDPLWCIFRTLADNEWVTLEGLAADCYLSRTAVQQRLALLKTVLAPYGLELVGQRGRGLRLVGTEAAWRRVMHRYLTDPAFLRDRDAPLEETSTVRSLQRQFDLLMPGFPLERVVDAVRQFEDERGKAFTDQEFFYIVAFLALAVARALQGHEGVPEVPEPARPGPAHDLLRRLADEFGIEEAQFHLDRGLLERYLALMEGDQASDGDTAAEWLVQSAVGRMEEFLGIPFSHDQLLIEALNLHIAAMRLAGREEGALERRNPVLAEIKREYPQIYFGVREVVDAYHQRTGRMLPPDEIGYLTMHFGASLLRQASRLRCVYVGGPSLAMASLTISRLQREFPGMQVRNVPAHRLEWELKKGGVDLVVQSVAARSVAHGDVPHIVVQPWLTVDDLRRCHHLINKILQSRFRQRLVVGSDDDALDAVLRQALWTFRATPAPPLELIERVARPLVDHFQLPPDFTDRVIEREQLGWSSLAEGIAVPHVVVLTDPSPGIAMSVATLTEPVRWGDVMVDIVAVLALHREAGSLFLRLFDWLADYARVLRSATTSTAVINRVRGG
jgi:transcriptional antiterminator/mannitol/fructose-specific phosphotransferase system IIA component (Ntr-type)